MKQQRRIVVTGLGVVSPIGQDVSTFSQRLFAGDGAIAMKDFPWRDRVVRYPVAAIPDFDPGQWMDPKKAQMLDRFAQFAVAAAGQAFADSGLTMTPELAERTAVITGTSVGGQTTLEESFTKLLPAENPRAHPFTIPRLMSNAGTSHICMSLGLTGPAFTVASACASSVHAMAVALTMLRSGLADCAVTGGAEACLTFGALKGWEALRIMASDTCRPFSEGRSGLVLGEGAAMFVLETLDAAQARGAKIYGELAGCAMTSDAKDITTPDMHGAARAIAGALADADMAPEDIDYINAHGTGTRINDQMETAAIKKVFGDRAKKLVLSAGKSLFGHALGGAGALEVLATFLALDKDIVPPTINYLGPDPECDLDYAPNAARPMPLRAALKNSFGFGGLNAVLAMRKLS